MAISLRFDDAGEAVAGKNSCGCCPHRECKWAKTCLEFPRSLSHPQQLYLNGYMWDAARVYAGAA
jgi:hypothetical protein